MADAPPSDSVTFFGCGGIDIATSSEGYDNKAHCVKMAEKMRSDRRNAKIFDLKGE